MPKKVNSKKTLKAKKLKKEKPFFIKYLNFPTVAVIFFVLLSLLTVVLITKPSSNVLGVKNSVSSSK